MTCEEFRDAFRSIGDELPTRGLRASLTAHCNACNVCHLWVKTEVVDKIPPEQLPKYKAASDALSRQDLQDPEFREVVRKGNKSE